MTEALLIFDESRVHGTEFLLCLNEDSKFGYQQSEDDAMLRLIDKTTHYVYKPPHPGDWQGLGSNDEIEEGWVRDSRPKVCN